MGQYWQWCNLSRSQNYSDGTWGKLGEWIGSSQVERLVPLLGMWKDEGIPHPLESWVNNCGAVVSSPFTMLLLVLFILLS